MKKFCNFRSIWFVTFMLIGLALCIAWGDSLLGFVAFLSGMICVFFAAIGNRHTYSIGIVNCITYGIVAYNSGLNGEMQLNLFFYLPLQFIGFYFWSKNLNKESKTVKINKLDWLKFAGVISLGFLLTYAYGLYLSTLDGQAIPMVDSFTTIFSIVASILMVLRFREYWWFYICVNVVSVIMWSHRAYEGVQDSPTMIVMWTAFLVNSIYGTINWHKKEKG